MKKNKTGYNYHIGVSGPEGTGKTEAILKASETGNVFRINEMARMVASLKDMILKNSVDEFSLLVLNALNASMHTVFDNRIIKEQGFNIISDRTLIDPLVYSNMYGGDQKIKTKDFMDYVKRLSDDFQRDFIYDDIIVAKPLTRREDILKIMQDPMRMYSQTVEKYLEDAHTWVGIYEDIAGSMEQSGLYKKIHFVDTYPIRDIGDFAKGLIDKNSKLTSSLLKKRKLKIL